MSSSIAIQTPLYVVIGARRSGASTIARSLPNSNEHNVLDNVSLTSLRNLDLSNINAIVIDSTVSLDNFFSMLSNENRAICCLTVSFGNTLPNLLKELYDANQNHGRGQVA